MPKITDSADFSGPAITNPNLSASFELLGITFSATNSSGYTLSSSSTAIKLTLDAIGTGLLGAIDGENTSGTNTISAPIILGAAAGSTQTFTQAAGGTMILSGAISSTNNVTLDLEGLGTRVFSGVNTYLGATTVSAGVLNIQNGSALGTTALGTIIASGATLQLQGGITVGAEALTISGIGAAGQNGALVNVSGTNNYGGLVTLGAATTISSNSGNLNLTNTGTITGATFGLTLTGAGSGSISSIIGTTSGTLTESGLGTWTLTGANTYTGNTLISSGILNIQNDTGLGTTASGTTVSSGATLQLQGGINVGSEALGISGIGAAGQNGALVNVSGTNSFGGLLTLGAATTISSDSGTINLTNIGTITGATYGLTLGGSGNGSLSSIIGTTTGTVTKNGTGSWTLTGVNTYTGATTVNAGSLFINGSTAFGSAVSVYNSGTTLGGSGTINGSVNLVSAGTNLSPGSSGVGSISILQTGSVTLGIGSNFNLDINGAGAGTGYDQLKVTGTVSINGSNLSITAGPGLTIGQTFYIVLNDGSDAITGTFAQGSTVMAINNGDVFLINYAANGDGGPLSNDISLTVSALPEPSTWLPAVFAITLLIPHERRNLGGLLRWLSSQFLRVTDRK